MKGRKETYERGLSYISTMLVYNVFVPLPSAFDGVDSTTCR